MLINIKYNIINFIYMTLSKVPYCATFNFNNNMCLYLVNELP